MGIVHGVADILVLVILFGLAIFVHELGHFLMARWCGMVVDTFSLGFGPAIWRKKINGIVYKIGWIPFGGYVALPQLDPTGMATIQGTEEKEKTEVGDQSSEVKEELEDESIPRVVPPISPWKKILVSIAGPAGNVALAVIIAWIIYFYPKAGTGEASGPLILGVVAESEAYKAGLRTGDEVVAINGHNVATWYEYTVELMLGSTKVPQAVFGVKSDGVTREVTVATAASEMGGKTVQGLSRYEVPVVGELIPGRSAEQAGLQPGDVIKSFAGEEVLGPEHFSVLVGKHADEEVSISIERAGKIMEMKLTPKFDEKEKRPLVGIRWRLKEGQEPVFFWMQYKKPMDQLVYDAQAIKRLLQGLVTPKEFKQVVDGLGGPVSIVATLWLAIKISFLNGVGFLRFLCINLAILNLLPIPVLDGGHVVFSLFEGITRRRINAKIVNGLVNFFAVLLIAAILFITYKDILRLPMFFKFVRGKEEKAARNAGTIASNVVEQATNAAPQSTDGK